MLFTRLRWLLTYLPLFAILLIASPGSVWADATLVSAGSSWKYLDNGTDQGSAWTAVAFNDSAWDSGPAQLGYGDNDEATVIGYGSNASSKYATTYFRQSFYVGDTSAFTSLNLRLLRDDGAVVYLNGIEIYRSNMPSGTITSTTWASSALGSPAESTFVSAALAASFLTTGLNTIAVEVHQANATSTDLSFDMELTASSSIFVTRGPYLQLITPTGVHVRWRTNAPTDSRVSFSSNLGALDQQVVDEVSTTEHEVVLRGLSSDTMYHYQVGSTAQTLAGGNDYLFYTAPVAGAEIPVRIWATGDLGTGTADAAAVRDAYASFAGARYTDVWLTMGDNEQNNGYDSQYQTNFFDMYAGLLKQSAVWTTLGNHDVNGSSTPAPNIPYYQNFTMPDKSQAGGVASETEAYYSFDYANIHFISLDSVTYNHSSDESMLNWLEEDLAQNAMLWTIAYWHYPPYTKGTHNSDTDAGLIAMRENVLPILENYGVDLVLCGHSHVYERSFLLNGHYDISSSFSSTMKVDGGSGQYPNSYTKVSASHAGTVYVVAGTAGRIGTGTLNHPAMYRSQGNTLGSMVLDIEGNRLDARFLQSNGTFSDSFTIIKNPKPNSAPIVGITNPASGALFSQPTDIAIAANASDSDGQIVKVEFFAGSTRIGEATYGPPYSATWVNVPAGTHALTAIATDNLGAATTSTAVPITVTAAPAPPAAPSALKATALKKQVRLNWTQSTSTGVNRNRIYRGATASGSYSVLATIPAATSYLDTTVAARKTYYYKVTAINGSNVESTASNPVSVITR